MNKVKHLLLEIPHRVKVFFFSWVLVNMCLFFVSAFLTKWSFRVNSTEAEPIEITLHSWNAIAWGERVVSQNEAHKLLLVVYCFPSRKVLFPFPKEFISYYNSNWFDKCYGRIGAFRIESYDWTELIIYTLIPLLIILFSAWLSIQEEKHF